MAGLVDADYRHSPSFSTNEFNSKRYCLGQCCRASWTSFSVTTSSLQGRGTLPKTFKQRKINSEGMIQRVAGTLNTKVALSDLTHCHPIFLEVRSAIGSIFLIDVPFLTIRATDSEQASMGVPHAPFKPLKTARGTNIAQWYVWMVLLNFWGLAVGFAQGSVEHPWSSKDFSLKRQSFVLAARGFSTLTFLVLGLKMGFVLQLSHAWFWIGCNGMPVDKIHYPWQVLNVMQYTLVALASPVLSSVGKRTLHKITILRSFWRTPFEAKSPSRGSSARSQNISRGQALSQTSRSTLDWQEQENNRKHIQQWPQTVLPGGFTAVHWTKRRGSASWSYGNSREGWIGRG